MNIILSSSERLRAFYGRTGARLVEAAAEQLVAARAARGVPSRLLAIEQGAPDLGVPPALVTPDAIARQVAELSAALDRRGQRLASLLLLGGPEIVPFHEAENPTPYDGDANVPGDCYYGPCNPFALLPDWPVGRIPGAYGNDPQLLVQLITHAAGCGPLRPFTKIFGYATAVWRRGGACMPRSICPSTCCCRRLTWPPASTGRGSTAPGWCIATRMACRKARPGMARRPTSRPW
ncbi:MAG: C25 family cysteine peptidase [Kouleothrix sp.]